MALVMMKAVRDMQAVSRAVFLSRAEQRRESARQAKPRGEEAVTCHVEIAWEVAWEMVREIA